MKIECGLCQTRNCSQETDKKTITKNPQGEITAIEVNNLSNGGNLCISRDTKQNITAIEVNGRGIDGCLIRRQILSSSVII